MYGKVMSHSDNLILLYFELLTDVPDPELDEMAQRLEAQSVNPMDLKKRLACRYRDAISQPRRGAKGPRSASPGRCRRRSFRRYAGAEGQNCHQAIDRSKGIVTVSVPALLVETNLSLVAGEAKRLIAQGAVEIGGERVTENDWACHNRGRCSE